MASMATSTGTGTFQEFISRADNSWVQELTCDPEAINHVPNKISRQVKSGHYVPVLPSPLPKPSLVIFSQNMANELGLSSDTCNSELFIRYFSGDMKASVISQRNNNEEDKDSNINPLTYPNLFISSTSGRQGGGGGGGQGELILKSWCTPYALSIMGTQYYNNCPFGNGNGYGDGRAISIGEVVIPKEARVQQHGIEKYQDEILKRAAYPAIDPLNDSLRWELQIKGAGTTPFCRGADGRAVLRSSIREFLASELMHNLGVPTTRALSLVKSDSETARRGWYSGKVETPISIDDPRLAGMPLQKRQMIVARYTKEANSNPDVAIFEPCAMTCRVSPSFTRIGHIDLFARRAIKKKQQQTKDHRPKDVETLPSTLTSEMEQLSQIVKHAIRREYPHLISSSSSSTSVSSANDIVLTPELLLSFMDESAQRIASLTANWLRVGFAQGNFNADNCLLGGRTMDYGPFGYMESYQRTFAKWTGSGDHFGFINQPQAGFVNWQVLVQSVAPLLQEYNVNNESLESLNDKVEECIEKGMSEFVEATRKVWFKKLGFQYTSSTKPIEETHDSIVLFETFETLLTRSQCDFTIVFRELANIIESTIDKDTPASQWKPTSSRIFSQNSELMQPFRNALDKTQLDADDHGDAEDVITMGNNEDAVTEKEWSDWIRDWLTALENAEEYEEKEGEGGEANRGLVIAKRLRAVNPKYVAREWMLVEAYDKANETGDFEMVHRLYDIFSRPYDEQSEETSRYFYRRKLSVESKPGVAFMT